MTIAKPAAVHLTFTKAKTQNEICLPRLIRLVNNSYHVDITPKHVLCRATNIELLALCDKLKHPEKLRALRRVMLLTLANERINRISSKARSFCFIFFFSPPIHALSSQCLCGGGRQDVLLWFDMNYFFPATELIRFVGPDEMNANPICSPSCFMSSLRYLAAHKVTNDLICRRFGLLGCKLISTPVTSC